MERRSNVLGRIRAATALATLALCACPHAPDPERYRLAGAGAHWDEVRGDRVFDEMRQRYPAYFEVILDPGTTREPDLRPLRDDLERAPVDQRNYDSLNAIAIGYFELNYRAESDPGGGSYFADSFRAAKLVAVPWRAYGEIDDPALRDSILDFFEDAGSGEKLLSAGTAPRLARIVADLEQKEDDPARQERIRTLAASLAAAGGAPAPF